MIHKAWEVAQNEYNNTIDWFVMIEADTSISHLNLLHFLRTKDPSQPHYIGSPAMLVADGSTFNHGGSGVVMSRTAIEKVETKRRTFTSGHEGSEQMSMNAYDKHWEKHTEEICCGDSVLAHAFTDVGVSVTGARPMIQGDTVLSIPWELPDPGRADTQLWCQTPITWHHVHGAQIDDLFQFQQKWVDKANGGYWNQTYLFRDVFQEFVAPQIEHASQSTKESWDNQSDWFKIESAAEPGAGVTVQGPDIKMPSEKDQSEIDAVTAAAVDNAKNCQAACERRGAPHAWSAADDCVQWKWAQGKCYLDYKIRLGEIMTDKQIEEHKVTWTSGWVKERVQKWKGKQGNCGARTPPRPQKNAGHTS
jgi:hypothetical protein